MKKKCEVCKRPLQKNNRGAYYPDGVGPVEVKTRWGGTRTEKLSYGRHICIYCETVWTFDKFGNVVKR